MEKISAVYKIVNEVTGDFYVGSSKDVKKRWNEHKRPSTWERYSNRPLYQDMQKYGLDKFRFQILAPVMEEYLKQVEQEFIEMLNPTYNNLNAKGLNIERIRKTHKEYNKEYIKEWRQSDKGRESSRKQTIKYYHRFCSYMGETLTLVALSCRFKRAGIAHYVSEAKKYLIKGEN